MRDKLVGSPISHPQEGYKIRDLTRLNKILFGERFIEVRVMGNKIYPPIKIGNMYGRLKVLSEGPPATKNKGTKNLPQWNCECNCGNLTTVLAVRLKRGHTKSCGCIVKKHGEWQGVPEYRAWLHLKDRCHNPFCKSYPDYGGRGITVAQEWRDDYLTFLAYVGCRPSPAHSLDRIDNNKGYEPGNVRWATRSEQMRNTRMNRLLTFNGETKCLKAWAGELNINEQTLATRLRLG